MRSKPFESAWGGIEGSCEPQIVDVRARNPASEARFDHIEYAGQEGLSAPAVEPQDIGKCRQQVAVRRSVVVAAVEVALKNDFVEEAGILELDVARGQIAGPPRLEARIVVRVPAGVALLALAGDTNLPARRWPNACARRRACRQDEVSARISALELPDRANETP